LEYFQEKKRLGFYKAESYATGQNRLRKRAGQLANETRPLTQAVLTR